MNKEVDFLENVLSADNVVESICSNLDELLKIIPEISSMIGFEQKHPHHHLDVWQHTLCALSFSPNKFDIRLALLFHDIGKPYSFQEDNGIRHFKGHPEKSSQIAKEVLKRLGYNDLLIDYICKIICLHDTPLTQEDIDKNPELCKKIFEVQKCDVMAHNPAFNQKRLEYIESISRLFGENEEVLQKL